MEWRAAEAPECIWEVLSLNTQPKGKCLPLSVKNSRGFFCLVLVLPRPPGLGMSVDHVSSRKIMFFFPNTGDVVIASMITLCR